MSDAVAIAVGAVSALGLGAGAYRVAIAGEPARSGLARDAALEAAGLNRPFAGRAPADLGLAGAYAEAGRDDRATALVACALAQAIAELDAVRPGWRQERIGIAIGTSSGGMMSAERFFAERAGGGPIAAERARAATYFAPLDRALAAAFDEPARALRKRVQVLAACAASTIAIGLALRWLDRGACDLVLAGGYDGVSVFVAAGFEALRATTASRPRPFRAGRDGMSLGEGAGVVALVRDGDRRGATVHLRVAGFGGSTDAVHITAPDRTGGGLARAALAALADAGIPASDVGLVSAHATATPFNDPMEARAIARALGEGASPVVHPFKAQIGHTLGAAGVLEALAAADALRAGVAPAAAGEGEMDPDARVTLLERAEPRDLRAALKLSAAFGGANAALVLTAAPSGRRPRAARPVYLRAFARAGATDLAALSEATGIARDRLGRLDALGRLGLSAVAALAREVGREALEGAGVVVGHALATFETNDAFDARKRTRGAAWVEPRLFPATSPNAVGGEVAIAFRLTGPSCAVSSGLDGGTEALATAAELVAAGDAERIVVLAADDVGPASRALLEVAGWSDRRLETGAAALLLRADPDGAIAPVDLDGADLVPDPGRRAIGHLALVEWLERVAAASSSAGGPGTSGSAPAAV